MSRKSSLHCSHSEKQKLKNQELNNKEPRLTMSVMGAMSIEEQRQMKEELEALRRFKESVLRGEHPSQVSPIGLPEERTSFVESADEPEETFTIPSVVTDETETGRVKYSLVGDEAANNKNFAGQLDHQMQVLARTGGSVVHQNQRKAANDIISEFTEDRNTLLVAALGKTQSGKTGVMYSLIMEATNTSIDGYVPVKNVFVITGLSSNEWKEQTKARLPEILRENVFHRNELKKEFKKKINGKKNVLIIIDEVQIACKVKQSLHAAFEELLTTDYLMENDIKMVEFSATPNGTFSDLSHWGEHAKIVKINPGAEYVGHKELYIQGRMFQCRDLTIKENVEELSKKIESTYKTPKYHIIRTKVGGGQDECVGVFKSVFGEDFDYLYHDSGNLESIDKFLDEENEDFQGVPKKHTFIFLKEMARCAKTFNKKFIGVWYERAIKGEFNDDVAIQGLAGRATGYDDNGVSIVYTNLESIQRFIELWEKDFSPEVPWKSNTTTVTKKKKTTAKKTVNAALDAKEGDFEKPSNDLNEKKCVIYDNGGEGFKTFPELKKAMDHSALIKGEVTNEAIHDSSGYFISSKVAGSRKKTENSDNRFIKSEGKNENKLKPGSLAQVAERGHWVVYPVYEDKKSKPEEVRWYGKVRIQKKKQKK